MRWIAWCCFASSPPIHSIAVDYGRRVPKDVMAIPKGRVSECPPPDEEARPEPRLKRRTPPMGQGAGFGDPAPEREQNWGAVSGARRDNAVKQVRFLASMWPSTIRSTVTSRGHQGRLVLRQNVDVDIPLPMNREKMIARDGIEHQKTIAQPRHCPSDRVPANTPHNVLCCSWPLVMDPMPSI